MAALLDHFPPRLLKYPETKNIAEKTDSPFMAELIGIVRRHKVALQTRMQQLHAQQRPAPRAEKRPMISLGRHRSNCCTGVMRAGRENWECSQFSCQARGHFADLGPRDDHRRGKVAGTTHTGHQASPRIRLKRE